jgi:hypothetical protein
MPVASAMTVRKSTAVGMRNAVNCWLTIPAASAAASHAAWRFHAAAKPAAQSPHHMNKPGTPCETSASTKILCGDS